MLALRYEKLRDAKAGAIVELRSRTKLHQSAETCGKKLPYEQLIAYTGLQTKVQYE